MAHCFLWGLVSFSNEIDNILIYDLRDFITGMSFMSENIFSILVITLLYLGFIINCQLFRLNRIPRCQNQNATDPRLAIELFTKLNVKKANS